MKEKLSKKGLVLVMLVVFTSAVIFGGSDSYAATGWVWSSSGNNWWYDTGSGYAQSEYRDGYWLNAAGWYDASWNGSWQTNGRGWWFQSGSWYPVNQWLKIDGKWYHFNSTGYMDVNTWIGNDYVGDDGAWTTAPVKKTKYGDTIVANLKTYASGAVVNSRKNVLVREEKVTITISKNEESFNLSDYMVDEKVIMKNVNKAIGLKVGDTFELEAEYGDGSRRFVYTILEIK